MHLFSPKPLPSNLESLVDLPWNGADLEGVSSEGLYEESELFQLVIDVSENLLFHLAEFDELRKQ